MTDLFLPKVGLGPSVAEEILDGALLRIIGSDPRQGREYVTRTPLLELAAQDKADDMLARRWFGHTDPDGVSSNANVRNHGFPLPPWYGVNDNNVESIALNYRTGQAVFDAWLTSETHRRHILATDPFFAAQTLVGIGVAWGPGDSGIYIVFISAPPVDTWQEG